MVDRAERRFVSPDDVETQVFPWGRLQWLSEPRVTGSQVLTTGIVTLELGKGHARHNHPGCEEIIYVMDGEGEQFVELEDGEVITRMVRTGDLIHVPADMYHGTTNTGTRPMRLLVSYEKAGPEALLRSLPDCKIEAPRNAG
jgi:oxalate decarboxylase/phosphoglucose isomerase-like protein (cupin superfamily)